MPQPASDQALFLILMPNINLTREKLVDVMITWQGKEMLHLCSCHVNKIGSNKEQAERANLSVVQNNESLNNYQDERKMSITTIITKAFSNPSGIGFESYTLPLITL